MKSLYEKILECPSKSGDLYLSKKEFPKTPVEYRVYGEDVNNFSNAFRYFGLNLSKLNRINKQVNSK